MVQVQPANPAVVPASLNQAQVAQAMNDHDRAKRSTDILLFYGQPGRDIIAARLLIVRINDAATIAGWADNCKILEFKMCLRDKAIGWFEGLIEDGIDVNDWDVIKAEFLETYEPKYSAKTTCANFTEDGICNKVLKAEKATFNESVKVARNLETIQNDYNRLNKIAAVKAELQPEEDNDIIWENLT